MKKITVEDVLRIDPKLTVEDAERAIAFLERTPLTPDELYARDDPGFIHSILNPLARDRDGLTAPMREINAFADERGLPIPFPPHRPTPEE